MKKKKWKDDLIEQADKLSFGDDGGYMAFDFECCQGTIEGVKQPADLMMIFNDLESEQIFIFNIGEAEKIYKKLGDELLKMEIINRNYPNEVN